MRMVGLRAWMAAVVAVGATAVSVPSAQAQDDPRDPSAAPRRAGLLEAVTACRTLADGAARLACYDDAVAAFDRAERAGEVQVLDREQVRQTRTRLFGLDLDRFNLFTGGGAAEAIEAVDLTLTAARRAGGEAWVFDLSDGSTWRQIDTERLTRRPAPGAAVRIRRGAVGSYLLSVDGARSLRVRRER